MKSKNSRQKKISFAKNAFGVHKHITPNITRLIKNLYEKKSSHVTFENFLNCVGFFRCLSYFVVVRIVNATHDIGSKK